MKKFFYLTVLLGIILAAAVAYFNSALVSQVQKDTGISGLKDSIAKLKTPEVQEREVTAPPPLRSTSALKRGTLTIAGIITQTNNERTQNNLTALTENSSLNAAAQVKALDMFKRQYFEHVSPTGESASDLVKQQGYEYFLVGENLALGIYENDEDVVNAWMNSPGHRANILRSQYKEIGVGVAQGEFEGEKTWLAVQMFGTPRSVCAAPDDTKKAQIEVLQAEINDHRTDLEERKKQLDASEPKYGPAYEQKVDEYNQKVKEYNELVEKLKALTAEYNYGVELYNACTVPFTAS